MAWNEPGGNKRPDGPWGNGNNQGPPDLDKLLSKFFERLNGLFAGIGGKGGGGGNDKGVFSVIAIIALIVYAVYAFETVTEGEKGVVQQFGKFTHIIEPGPAFIWKPMQKMTIVNTQVVLKEGNENYRQSEREMLTEDENIVIVTYVVQYRINDPKDYLFNVASPIETLRQSSESAIREIVGRNTLDFVTKDGRAIVAQQAKSQTQEIMDAHTAGISIQSISLIEAQFPGEVQAAVDDVTKAREDRERYINEAEAYRNQIVPEARGQAGKRVRERKGYNVQVVKSAEGEASRFTQLLKEYKKAPGVMRKRLYIDMFEQVMSSTRKVIFDVEDGNNTMVYLPLDKIVNQGNAGGSAFTVPQPESNRSEPADALNSRSRSRARELR